MCATVNNFILKSEFDPDRRDGLIKDTIVNSSHVMPLYFSAPQTQQCGLFTRLHPRSKPLRSRPMGLYLIGVPSVQIVQIVPNVLNGLNVLNAIHGGLLLDLHSVGVFLVA